MHVGTSNVFHRLVTPDRVLAVRQLLRSHEETERQHELLTYLADRGFPAVPPFRTRSGETVVAIDERTFAVYPFVAGERPGAGDTVTASSVGWAAARLHALTGAYPYAAPNPRSPARDRFLASSSGWFKHAEGALTDPQLALAHDDVRWLTDAIAQIAEDLRRTAAQLPSAIVHGDVRADNLLLRDGSLVAVLDFDLATRDARVADLAVAIHFLYRARTRTVGSSSAASGVERLVAAYEEGSPLSSAERAALPGLVEAKAARRSMRMLRHVTKSRSEERAALLEKLVSSIRRLRALHEDPTWRAALG